MAFESSEAEYLERIRYRGQQQQPERHPARALRSAVATALVALASKIAPALPELSSREAPAIPTPLS
jgi:hypothetical protein